MGFKEGFHHLKALGQLLFLGLGAGGLRFFAQLHPHGLKIHFLQKGTDGFRAHAHGAGVFAQAVINLKELVLGNDLHLLEIGGAGVKHDVGIEIEHLFKIYHGHVEERTDLGGQGLQKPDMRDRRGQLDMAHALAAHRGGDDFNPALFADDAAVLHAFIFTAVTFVVLHRPENFGAEKAVAFGLEGTIVNGFRLLNFAERPLPDAFRRGDGNLDGLQVADIA